jgi:hypothetical protein
VLSVELAGAGWPDRWGRTTARRDDAHGEPRRHRNLERRGAIRLG